MDSALFPRKPGLVEDQVRAVCPSCDISGSCEWGLVFAGRSSIIDAHGFPAPSFLSPLGGARESVAMVTSGPGPQGALLGENRALGDQEVCERQCDLPAPTKVVGPEAGDVDKGQEQCPCLL